MFEKRSNRLHYVKLLSAVQAVVHSLVVFLMPMLVSLQVVVLLVVVHQIELKW